MRKPTDNMIAYLQMIKDGYNVYVPGQPHILSSDRQSGSGHGFVPSVVSGLITRNLIEERSSRAAKNKNGLFKLTHSGRRLINE